MLLAFVKWQVLHLAELKAVVCHHTSEQTCWRLISVSSDNSWVLFPVLFSRCAPGNPRPHDCEHYCSGGWSGCSLHGNEVHQLWRRRQSAQVPCCHDWWHHHPDRRYAVFRSCLSAHSLLLNSFSDAIFYFFLPQLCVALLPALGTLMTSSEPSMTPSPPSIQGKYF